MHTVNLFFEDGFCLMVYVLFDGLCISKVAFFVFFQISQWPLKC